MPTVQPLIDTALVRRLIAQQFPEWSALPVKPVAFGGWDNRTFHLGDRMTVRLPSAAHYAEQVAKEQHWLPILAPPIAVGDPIAARDGRSRRSVSVAVVRLWVARG